MFILQPGFDQFYSTADSQPKQRYNRIVLSAMKKDFNSDKLKFSGFG